MIRPFWRSHLLPPHFAGIRGICTSPLRFQEPRINQVGIQYLSNELHKKVFPKSSPEDYANPKSPALLELARAHLKETNLLGKRTQISEPINIPHFPELVGKNTLDEHFTRIGQRYSEPYLSMAKTLFAENQELPKPPTKWLFESGWTRYAPGAAPDKVEFPLEDELVFDVEVLYKISHYPVLATAASAKAWYGWVSPIMTTFSEGSSDWNHLIPFDTHSRPKLLVGYNVSYDRARVKEEYHVSRSKAFFMDAMAFHIATSGFCSQQRPLYQKHRKSKKAAESVALDEEGADENDDALLDSEGIDADGSAQEVAQGLIDDPWLNKGSPNSLANAAEFHCGIKMNKQARDYFSSTDLNEIIDNFQDLMKYCAGDVHATFKVTQKVFPEFHRRNPHPVSFAALRLMGSLFLPTTTKWENYIENAERVYQENREQVSVILLERVNELIRYVEQNDESLRPDFKTDPWLKQMNWDLKLPRLKKDGTPSAKQAYMTGYPEWYRDLFKTAKKDDGTSERVLNLTVRTRITPLLLRLKWEGYPLIWTDSVGWCFKVPGDDKSVDAMLEKNYSKASLSELDRELMLPELRDDGNSYELFKIPHPAGPKNRCTMIMSKSYLRYFESGVLTSKYEHAAKILGLNATASYWMGNRSRITEQFVVYADKSAKANMFFDTKKEIKANEEMGMILPKLCTMGTVTRRATENTWLTASNSKANRIGSELKAMIQAPKDYVFVGADVDSEELWIASLIGDSLFKIHGGTALGWMTLEGDKNEKTDLHSKTAEILGILRNEAKIFNYGRIYGAGVKFATQLLKQCNALLDDATAIKMANELYLRTKGQSAHSKVFDRRVYHGGTESVMFNALESIAYLESPKTPVLGASITDALTQKNLNKNNYLTSRINWTIQSSGVDYLHLLIVSMEYLIEKFKIDARLMITVHDELRYMVREDQKLACVLLLQISNLWTRAMFCEQLGILELPQSCAFFSEVDIDFVLRKEVGLECITPSHPELIPPGESFTIQKLMETYDIGKILGDSLGTLQKLKGPKFEKRDAVLLTLEGDLDEFTKISKLRLQNSVSKEEWTANMTAYQRGRRLALMGLSDPAESGKLKKKKNDEKGFVANNAFGYSRRLVLDAKPGDNVQEKFKSVRKKSKSKAAALESPKPPKKLRRGIIEDISLTQGPPDESRDDFGADDFSNTRASTSNDAREISREGLANEESCSQNSNSGVKKSGFALKLNSVGFKRYRPLVLAKVRKGAPRSDASNARFAKKDSTFIMRDAFGGTANENFASNFPFSTDFEAGARASLLAYHVESDFDAVSMEKQFFHIPVGDENFERRGERTPMIENPFYHGRRRR